MGIGAVVSVWQEPNSRDATGNLLSQLITSGGATRADETMADVEETGLGGVLRILEPFSKTVGKVYRSSEYCRD